MPSVCDYVVVQESEVTIGDSNIHFEKNFNTPDAVNVQGVLSFMVKGLTYANTSVEVKVNGTSVGHLAPNRWPTTGERDAAAAHVYSQHLVIPSILNSATPNELEIEAIGFPEATATNKFDDFGIRDVVCWYQRNS